MPQKRTLPKSTFIDKPITEGRFFHILALAMGAILLSLIGWIGLNVAHIPVIDQEINDLKQMIQDVVNKKIDDHETRIRSLENHKGR